MSLLMRLKTPYLFQRCVKSNFDLKFSFHSLCRAPQLRRHEGTRSFFKIFRKRSQNELKQADDIPDAFELIYRNTMSRYILGAQIVSILTGSVVILALIIQHDFADYQRKNLSWSSEARPREYEEMYYISVFIVILVLLQVMVSQTPIRIYKKPRTDNYIAINYGNYIFGKERLTFKRGEISQLPEKGILPWKGNRFLIESKNNRRNVILIDHFFRRPADFNIMLGEQRDPDLDDNENDSR